MLGPCRQSHLRDELPSLLRLEAIHIFNLAGSRRGKLVRRQARQKPMLCKEIERYPGLACGRSLVDGISELSLFSFTWQASKFPLIKKQRFACLRVLISHVCAILCQSSALLAALSNDESTTTASTLCCRSKRSLCDSTEGNTPLLGMRIPTALVEPTTISPKILQLSLRRWT